MEEEWSAMGLHQLNTGSVYLFDKMKKINITLLKKLIKLINFLDFQSILYESHWFDIQRSYE